MKRAFETEASRLEGQTGARYSYVSAAKEDFKGHFSEVFQTNATTAASDASALASALRTVAGYVQQMIDAGREEDARRRENNEWVRRHNNRSWLEEVGDWIWGEDPRPNMNPGPAPTFAPATASSGSRSTPPSGGGYGGGTTSARPSNLRTFAANSRSLDSSLAGAPGTLEGHLSSFASSCYWGRIDAAGVIRAYRQYLDANENDARWAVQMADAFAAAGGEGNVSTVSDAALNEALAAAGISATRSALAIDPPTAAGAMPSTGYANDPVNTATGNFIEPEADLGFTGTASNLLLTRMYNSLASGLEVPGVFGPGWASVLDQHLVLSDEGCRWVLADGRAVDFPRDGQGWARGVGENYWLTREPVTAPVLGELTSVPAGSTEVLVVRDNQGTWWAYTLAGQWLGTGAGPGRTVSVLRDSIVADSAAGVGEADAAATSDDAATSADNAVTAVVSRVEHVRGRFLDVEYVEGLIAVVRASDGRRVEYGYDDAGRLVTVTTETGTRTYRWNEQGLIDAVYSAAGVLEAENTYDEQGRVVLQLTQHGRRTRFAYLPGRVTVVSDEDGTRSNSWIADAKGRLVGVLDSHDQRQSMAYDAHGNLVSFTERDGSVTVHAYDERGRKTRTVTAEGADLTYGWDEQDRITTLVTESGSVVTYEYADELSRDPAVILDPLGGRTELTWRDGLLIRVVDPAGVSVGFEYDAYGELTATSNAAGDTARIVRDSAGRPVTAISPSGAQTRFTYDAAGLLVRREDPDGAAWSFEHDTAGRITAVIAPDGGRTALDYAANGELVRTTDPLGRSIERIFDELGNVTAAVLPDGARWGFTHDTLSRLTGITDPAGHDWIREYDKVGTLTAVVDPTGVRIDASTDRKSGTAVIRDAFCAATYSFDEYGRPVRSEAEDGTAELVTYDAAGNPVELLDGEGGLTVLGRDVAGKITSITSPSGAVTRYEYDDCGRPWKTTDPLGAVTELVYDVDQRVVARILPTGDTETFGYDACGRLVLRRSPGSGVARYGYDKAGRLSFSQDSWYGTRRFKYNQAGELVETVNGVGGRTRFEYDSRGRLVRITDPTGGVTVRSYTETDQVESVTDPLGRVTTATYDPAGRQLTQTDPDGNTTAWTYDAAGREKSTSFNGRLLCSVDRDAVSRRVVITDHTGDDGLVVEHELGFDRRGQLTSRTRGGQGLSWSYDADGHRTGFTDTTGTTTTYSRDAAGRVKSVHNPRLGEATFTHDAAGRLTAVTAGELVQEWEYRNGVLAEHSWVNGSDSAEAADITLIGRDEDGRITGLTRAGTVTRYGYDGAGQLIAAATTPLGESGAASSARTQVSEWQYDDGGRLVREFTPAGPRSFAYDAAGQLVSVTEPDGSRTEYVYDGLGRRSRLIGPDGSWTEYVWGAAGYLRGTVDRTRDGEKTTGHELWVDALGELASVDGCPVWWDTANPVPTLAGISDQQVLNLPGGVTGFGESWLAPGWRAARPTDEADPWAVLGVSMVPEPGAAAGMGTPGALAGLSGPAGMLPSGVSLTGGGGLEIAGLEWLGARAYDPMARGFLSTDPLTPVLGAGWDGNPYSYAGNNPLNATDPTGLRPLTDEELKAYDQQAGSHWETILGAVAVAAAVGVMFVPGLNLIAAGAIAGALASGGMSMISQDMQSGSVDWWSVLGNAAVGGVTGAIGGGAATWAKGLVTAAPAQAAAAFRTAAGVGGGLGSLGGGATYLAKNDWQIKNGWEFAGSIAGGGFAGAVGGLAVPFGGSLAMAAGRSSTSFLSTVLTAGMGGMGAGGGAALDGAISGKSVDPVNIGTSALFGTVATAMPINKLPVVGGYLEQTGVNTLKQMPYFAPRTLSGAFNFAQTNTIGLWGGTVGGLSVGAGGDTIRQVMGW
ncbi:type IV secretion protein Rhs [Arthrobacter sp. Sa2CUA1]|uniref:Type IV secretion protein Rhs n=1 Tax=Arthrobacter gallicola TaxID=2762225 RepID=A0ABR8UUP9_9MICC|nr:DUF6531 domain-containing protein [Arthrobacter gallicola]MBD7996263.1 type IV secretion protein Rhs [Arthrobacter gallicola]